MKWLHVFIVATALLGVVVAFQCPKYPSGVDCFRDPCEPNPCKVGETCCADYSVGCNCHCLPSFQCPKYPVKGSCLVAPCSNNNCKANEVCCDDYSDANKPCQFHCFAQ